MSDRIFHRWAYLGMLICFVSGLVENRLSPFGFPDPVSTTLISALIYGSVLTFFSREIRAMTFHRNRLTVIKMSLVIWSISSLMSFMLFALFAGLGIEVARYVG